MLRLSHVLPRLSLWIESGERGLQKKVQSLWPETQPSSLRKVEKEGQIKSKAEEILKTLKVSKTENRKTIEKNQ